MSLISCIILEDEPLALERMKSYVGKVESLQLLQSFTDATKAYNFLVNQPVDLIFLDIEMERLTGIQLLEALKKKPYTIITTAYEQYALKGYELNVVDYLLKPFPFNRFIAAVEKVMSLLRPDLSASSDFFFVKTEYRLEKLFYRDMLYIEGVQDYRCIHTRDKQILTLQSFLELEKLLPKEKICRVHKSYMVNLSMIETLERDRIRIGKKLIPISDTFKSQVYALLGI